MADAPAAGLENEEILKLCFRRAGQVYWGECVKRGDEYIRHGHGLQVWGAQTVHNEAVVVAKYHGTWVNGRMTGSGRMEFYDTSVYSGDFEDGDLNGVGKLTWPDGTTYDGCWLRNQMDGQGRLLTRTGDFWEGHFHRNCFLQHSGKWLDLAKEQTRLEQLALAEGVVGPDTPVTIVETPDRMHQAIRACRDANLVPFLIADTVFNERLNPLDWLRSSGTAYGKDWEKCAVFIKYLAQMRRRKQNYTGHLYQCLQTGILEGLPVPVVFDDPGEDALPEPWRLENFYDNFSAPREMFDPRLFHGRGFVEFFLPDEVQEQSVFTKTFPAPPPPPPPADTPDPDPADPAAAAAPEPAPAAAAGSEDVRQTAFMLDLHVVALGRIRSEIVDDHELVRHEMKQRFGAHIPLHRCGILILSGGIGDLGGSSAM